MFHEEILLLDRTWAQNYFASLCNFDEKAFMGMSLRDSKEDILSFEGSTATVQVKGPLSPNGPSFFERLFGYGGTAYGDIMDALERVEKADVIKLAMDTPGGSVKGLEPVAQKVADLAKTKKVIAENHGLVASAGYWIASQASEIVAMSQTATTGSIGVLVTATDTSERDKACGIKRIIVSSESAPNKDIDVGTAEGLKILQERANSLERVFLERVAEGRGVSVDTVKAKFGQGGLMIASDPSDKHDDALSVNMIDRIATDEPKKAAQDETTRGERVETMSYEEFMKQHPDLARTVDARVKEAKEEGKTEGKELERAKAKEVNKYLESSEYPEPIKAMACKVISGEKSLDTLEGAVVAYDAMKADRKMEEAKENSEEDGDIPAAKGKKKSIEVAETLEEVDALIDEGGAY